VLAPSRRPDQTCIDASAVFVPSIFEVFFAKTPPYGLPFADGCAVTREGDDSLHRRRIDARV
jgi:hypothetical protein